MGEIRSHRDLEAWQRAVELSVELYRLTAAFPETERYGLVSQIRRAGVSIASNIAEGYGRGSRQDYIRFLRMARASLHEIDTQLFIANRLNMTKPDSFESISQLHLSCTQLVAGLLRSLDPQSERMPPAEQRMPN